MTEVRHRVGRRGAVLTLLGLVYALIGVSYVTDPLTASQQQILHLATQIAPIAFWGSCYIVIGLLAVLAAYWPPGRDWWGFGALMLLSVAWTGTYVAAVFNAVDGAFIGVLRQVVVITLLAIISGWREPRRAL